MQGPGPREVYDSAGHDYSLSRERFFLLGELWIAAMEGEPPAERSYQHVAFTVAELDLPLYRTRLEALGVKIRPPRSRVSGEGLSLYFYDFDNHLFELYTGTLEQRLASYGAGTRLWSGTNRRLGHPEPAIDGMLPASVA